MAKIKYYDITELLKRDAEYNILLGQRANGKSYQVKKTIIEDAWKNDSAFIYLRRWQADVKTKAVEQYFDDCPISKITKGEYDRVFAWNGEIFFGKLDSEGRAVKGKRCGWYCALNEYERYKSRVFPNVKYIDYEEFITDALYLVDEPRLLQQFVSTIARHNRIQVFLVGNTLSRVCPYFAQWCLEGVLKQKIGTIEMYNFHVDGDIIHIAVEYCANADAKNTMFFGQAAKQIKDGAWDVTDVNKLPKKRNEYQLCYEILIEYQSFKFVCELLVEPKLGGVVCFIYPHTKNRKIKRIISDRISDDPLVTTKLVTSRRVEALIADCFRNNKVCYSDNLTGADFKAVNEHFKLSSLF